jgi:hypothetical protein
MAGASYLNLMVLFDLAHHGVFESFQMVNQAMTFLMVAALEKEDAEYFNSVALHFAFSASDGVFKNCVGSLDGWAVHIKTIWGLFCWCHTQHQRPGQWKIHTTTITATVAFRLNVPLEKL